MCSEHALGGQRTTYGPQLVGLDFSKTALTNVLDKFILLSGSLTKGRGEGRFIDNGSVDLFRVVLWGNSKHESVVT